MSTWCLPLWDSARRIGIHTRGAVLVSPAARTKIICSARPWNPWPVTKDLIDAMTEDLGGD